MMIVISKKKILGEYVHYVLVWKFILNSGAESGEKFKGIKMLPTPKLGMLFFECELFMFFHIKQSIQS